MNRTTSRRSFAATSLAPENAAERGGILMLLAVLVAAVGGVLILLAVDSVIVKVASTELREKLEVICRKVAENPVIQRSATTKFSDLIKETETQGLPRFSTITAARLMLPTMPADGQFYFPLSRESQDSNSSTGQQLGKSVGTVASPDSGSMAPVLDTIPIAGQVVGNSAQPIPGCGSVQDCEFYGDVKPSNLAQRYPVQMWNNFSNAGGEVGCEMEARVTGTMMPFLRDRTIVARAVWARPPRGKKPLYDPADAIATSPGLTIAIAPEMSTNAQEPRYRFDADYDVDSFRIAYDPLLHYDIPGPSTIDAFSSLPTASTQRIPFSGTPQAVVAVPKVPSAASRWGTAYLNTGNYQSRYGPPYADYTDPNALVLSDREELLASCANPVTTLRDAFVQTILEHAARHGQTRTMTELLVVNPKHRTANAPLNFPAQVAAFGDDIAQKAYEIPFMFWDTGPGTDGSIQKNGPLQPFVGAFSGQPNGSDWEQHHAMVAGQLRSCYHLYRSRDDNALDRLRLDAYSTTATLNNSGFEPNIYNYEASLRLQPYSTNQLWDQECPGLNGCSMSQTRGLSGAEFAAALGTVQDCPYEESSPIFQTCPYSTYPAGLHICRKPPDTCTDTGPKPDILGLLYYLARKQPPGSAYYSDGGQSGVPAIKPPGIFPVANAGGPLYFSPTSDHYALTKNLNSTILLVMHRALDKADIDPIRNLVMSEFGERPITIAFFPVIANESSPEVIADIIHAFNVGTNSQNILHIFSPYNLKFFPSLQGSSSTSSGNSSSTSSSTSTTSSSSSGGSSSTSTGSSSTSTGSSSTSTGSSSTSTGSSSTSTGSSSTSTGSSSTSTGSSSTSTGSSSTSTGSSSTSTGSSSTSTGSSSTSTGYPVNSLRWPEATTAMSTNPVPSDPGTRDSAYAGSPLPGAGTSLLPSFDKDGDGEIFDLAAPPSTNFSLYDRYMLTNNNPDINAGENIYQSAQQIFLNNVLRYELKH